MDPPISVVVERGPAEESWHRVHAVEVRDGHVSRAAGDPELVTFMRSAAKPFQALPLALEETDLTQAELAIACASHEAGEEQLAAVRALLARAAATEDDLECGEEGGARIRNNCSGKHAGMLLRARRKGWPLPGYRLPEHPLQQEMREVVADAVGMEPGAIPIGTDGCGIPAYAVPLRAMALAFARLAREELPGSRAVVAAMRARPDLIGGPSLADTALMRGLPGAVAKRGAEGLLCAALPDGRGVAVKVEDGADRAALPAAAAYFGIEPLAEAPVYNSRGDRVGRIRTFP